MNKQQREQLQAQRWKEMSAFEHRLREDGVRLIAGLDEAGRGPLAGPVAAAAVILPADCYLPGLDDSKKLSARQRLLLEEQIKGCALAWACALVDHQLIDEINILQAARLAMLRAVEQLNPAPQHLLIDALHIDSPLPQTALIHGDSLSVSIAAASILAKCERDRLMCEYDLAYPEYGFAQHKGYGTAAHKQALHRYGPSPIHRRSFKY